MEFKIIKNSINDLATLKEFLGSAGKSLERFRYFSKRDLSVIEAHFLTVLGIEAKIPICYGHLDPEGSKLWLGICVKANLAGNGYGYEMMTYLLNYAKKKKIKEVYLKVDIDNAIAISMYKTFNFKVIEEAIGVTYTMKVILI